jgi:hypothetical protein
VTVYVQGAVTGTDTVDARQVMIVVSGSGDTSGTGDGKPAEKKGRRGGKDSGR